MAILTSKRVTEEGEVLPYHQAELDVSKWRVLLLLKITKLEPFGCLCCLTTNSTKLLCEITKYAFNLTLCVFFY